MKVLAAREGTYTTLTRLAGVLLVLTCVFFQRRELIHWTEVLFLGLCVGLQETFLRLGFLRRWRSPMLVAYSMLPLALVLYHTGDIRRYGGNFVEVVLFTPLPLVLVSVQIMVLYARESARLVSVVLVLCLFSTVIGVRRPLDDVIWPWLAAIGASTTLFLLFQYPGMLFQGVYVSRRKGGMPPAGRPGGIIRAAFFSVVPLFVAAVLLASLFLYVALPRLDVSPDSEPTEIAVNGEFPDGIDRGPTPPGRERDETRRNPNRPEREGPASVSGLAEGVDLGDFGEILRTEDDALTVEILDPPDARISEVYLRAFTYGTFDGYGWQPVPTGPAVEHEVPAGADRPLPGAPDNRGLAWRARRYRVEVLESGLGAAGQMPCPTEAVEIRAYDDPLFYHGVAHTLRGPLLKPGDLYQVTARQLVLRPNQLAQQLAEISPARSPRPEYLQLPTGLKESIRERFHFYDRYNEMIAGNERGVPASRKGVYAAASDIVTMFRDATAGEDRAWSYSLDFRPEPGPDAIARFLDTKTGDAERFGHCEYFASAMCVLMRCYGVPARVAAGFHASDPDENGIFDVKTSSAHAWVEVYFDGFGWIKFDPTPPEDTGDEGEALPQPDDSDEPEDQEDPDATVEEDAGEDGPRDWFERFDEDRQRELFSDIGGFFKDGLSRADEALKTATAWMPGVLPDSGLIRALMLVSPLTLGAAVFIWLRRKRKKIERRVLGQMGEGGRKHQRGLYFQLLLLLSRYGYQKRPSETPREFAERVLRRGGDRHQPILELTEIYYALRFGLNPDKEGDFKRALSRYADALKTEGPATPPAASRA